MDSLPEGLRREGCTPAFDETSLPTSLQRRHALPPGRWGLLRVAEGQVEFEDLTAQTRRTLKAPAQRVIEPESPHRLHLVGPVRLQIEFYVSDSPVQG